MSEALDDGPFFHGTKADLAVGDILTPGFRSNYRPEVIMNHVYFTALVDGAGLAAEVAAGDGEPRVRSAEGLRIVGEVTDWTRLTPDALQSWRDRIAALRADPTKQIID